MPQIVESKQAKRGASGARYVQAKIKQAGIRDVEMFYDEQLRMWAVCQVVKPTGQILVLREAHADVQPTIMFWCKDGNGKYREPGDEDVHNIIVITERAKKVWAEEEKHPGWLADQLDKQDAEKQESHNAKKQLMARDTAKKLVKAANRTIVIGGNDA